MVTGILNEVGQIEPYKLIKFIMKSLSKYQYCKFTPSSLNDYLKKADFSATLETTMDEMLEMVEQRIQEVMQVLDKTINSKLDKVVKQQALAIDQIN